MDCLSASYDSYDSYDIFGPTDVAQGKPDVHKKAKQLTLVVQHHTRKRPPYNPIVVPTSSQTAPPLTIHSHHMSIIINNIITNTQQAPRTLAVQQLQMVGGGPRGRSGGGVNIEGANGAKAVLASAMPVQGIQQRSLSADADEYGESGAFVSALLCPAGTLVWCPIVSREPDVGICTPSVACTASLRFPSHGSSLALWPVLYPNCVPQFVGVGDDPKVFRRWKWRECECQGAIEPGQG